MSDINYFQKYSQAENHITNNTLLMLRQLYRAHPGKLQAVLERVFTDDSLTTAGQEEFELTVGPTFSQQVGGSDSTPDAVLSQQAFDIVVEVKPHGSWSASQLKRHVRTAASRDGGLTVVLLLSTDKAPAFGKDLVDLASEMQIVLAHTTFDSLLDAMEGDDVIAPHETNLADILDDYRDFLWDHDLLDDPYEMFAFGCSRTLKWNLANNMYYDHLSRPSKANVLTGFYANREIHALGKPAAVVTGPDSGKFVVERSHPSDSDASVIEKVKAVAGEVDTSEPLRWYVYDDIHRTSFKKSTPYGYFQGVWMHLEDAVGEADIDPENISALAEAIDGKTFGNDRGYSD